MKNELIQKILSLIFHKHKIINIQYILIVSLKFFLYLQSIYFILLLFFLLC